MIGRVLVLFVAAGVGLTLCDQVHTQSGVLGYDTGGYFGQAWWVPLQFGLASLAIVGGAREFARGVPEPSDGDLLRSGAWLVAAYAASGIFDAHPWALLGAYVAVWAARMARAEPRGPAIAVSLLLAVGGPAVEALLAGAGTFEYANPDLVGIPLWLPGLYLHGGPLALGVARRWFAPAHGERVRASRLRYGRDAA
jgi:hypothetical protein